MQFTGFHRVDLRQDIGIPVHRIDAVAFGRSDEGKVDGRGLGTFVRAAEKAVLTDQNPCLDGPFRFVVINGDVRILEEFRKGDPMIQSVIDSLHQVVSRMKSILCLLNNLPQPFDQGLRPSAPDGQSILRGLVLYLPFNGIQVPVDIENCVANVGFRELGLKVTPPGMRTASRLDSPSVFEQRIVPSGGISLHNAAIVFEELKISVEREVRRIVKDCDFVIGVTYVGRYLAFLDVVLVRAILHFNGRIVCLDYVRSQDLLDQPIVEQAQSVCGGLHPIALGRARDLDLLAGKYFALTIVGKSVIMFADNYLTKEPRTGITAGNWRTRFLRGDDVLLTFGARSCFLNVFQHLQTCTDHLQLVCDLVANELGLSVAVWANGIFRSYVVRHWLFWQVLRIIEDVFNSCRTLFARRITLFIRRLCYTPRRTGIVFLCFLAILPIVAFLRLRKQRIKLRLQIFQDLVLLSIVFQRKLELLLQLLNESIEAHDLNPGFRMCLSQDL